MKKKLLQIVLPIFAWRQRIAKTLCPEKLERVVYDGARIGILCRPGLCEFAHRRTNRRRKLDCFSTFSRRQFICGGRRRRNNFVSAGLSNFLSPPALIAPS